MFFFSSVCAHDVHALALPLPPLVKKLFRTNGNTHTHTHKTKNKETKTKTNKKRMLPGSRRASGSPASSEWLKRKNWNEYFSYI